ncbi:Integrase, catalytic core protein [Phytophthora megakarya]|uniref:Integrase, catalytic core protein n=1 Tax=Phytophthora megakarya TaxID=4795 RepID=A0A225UUP8_9STRA|nr:Integrase, catalytic core protein [Phytophthora megakarya]
MTVLERFGMSKCNGCKIPCSADMKLTKAMCAADADEKMLMNSKPYRSVVGSLMYLMLGSRPGLAYLSMHWIIQGYYTGELQNVVFVTFKRHWNGEYVSVVTSGQIRSWTDTCTLLPMQISQIVLTTGNQSQQVAFEMIPSISLAVNVT